jgi:hypothetical protein
LHIVYIGSQFGSSILTQSDKNLLSKYNIDWRQFPDSGKVDHAFKFGVLSEALGDKRAKSMNYAKFKEFLSSGRFIPLTEAEEKAVSYLKSRAYNDLKGLSETRKKALRTMISTSESERGKMLDQVLQKETSEGAKNRKTHKEIASAIRQTIKDPARDIDRIIDHVMHEAHDYGRAYSILRRTGPEAKVWFSVLADACDECVRIYLKNGAQSEPKVFKLSEVIANGNNIGRKRKDWKPVLGPVHPYCRCQSNEYKDKYVWNSDLQMFVPPKVERKRRSRAKVTVTEG